MSLALAAAVAAAVFLFFWNDQGDAYTDGLLVNSEYEGEYDWWEAADEQDLVYEA